MCITQCTMYIHVAYVLYITYTYIILFMIKQQRTVTNIEQSQWKTPTQLQSGYSALAGTEADKGITQCTVGLPVRRGNESPPSHLSFPLLCGPEDLFKFLFLAEVSEVKCWVIVSLRSGLYFALPEDCSLGLVLLRPQTMPGLPPTFLANFWWLS